MIYKPKSSHPWKRSYKAPKEDTVVAKSRTTKSVKVFISELVENWENIQTTTSYSDTDKKFLEDLPQEKQVVWFTSLLKKAYGIQAYHEYD